MFTRLFVGSIDAPERNELQSAESEDHEAMVALAVELAGRGFHVWLYSHHHGDGPNGHRAPYRVIGEWAADGQRGSDPRGEGDYTLPLAPMVPLLRVMITA